MAMYGNSHWGDQRRLMSQSGETSKFLLGQENWDSKVIFRFSLPPSSVTMASAASLLSTQNYTVIQVPLKVTLAQSEITTIDNPPPLYVSLCKLAV